MTGVSGSGVEDHEDVEGVLEEQRDVEGRDADCRATLSPESLAKPLAGADEECLLEDTGPIAGAELNV